MNLVQTPQKIRLVQLLDRMTEVWRYGNLIMTKTGSQNRPQPSAKAASTKAAVPKQVSTSLTKTEKVKPGANTTSKKSQTTAKTPSDKSATVKRVTTAKKTSSRTTKTAAKLTSTAKKTTTRRQSTKKATTETAKRLTPKRRTTRCKTQAAKAEGIIQLTLGEYIHSCIKKQFTQMMRQEADVLRDFDPEPLHQMRVNSRRLRATMQCFGAIVVMPKKYQPKHLRQFNQPLGVLRNLDVVIEQLQTDYYPQLPDAEQVLLDRALKRLHKRRRRAFKAAKKAITKQSFSAIYGAWLKQPEYVDLAQQSVSLTLPNLLMPQLSKFLGHPAWSIAAVDVTPENQTQLHHLRKVCKHWRYQIEPVKTTDNADWLDSLKALQDCLGKLQDLAVLRQMLTVNLPTKRTTPALDKIFQQQHTEALAIWEVLRHPYLDAKHHHQCYDWVLNAL